MEYIKNVIFSTPLLRVLDFLLEKSGLELSDLEITNEIKGAKRAAVHQALIRLNEMGITRRVRTGKRCYNSIDYQNAWITPFKIASNILTISPLVDEIKEISTKIILFGSRATGDNRSDSDFDLLVIAGDPNSILKKIGGAPNADRVQLIIKSPEEMLAIEKNNVVLSDEIRKGVTLWER